MLHLAYHVLHIMYCMLLFIISHRVHNVCIIYYMLYIGNNFTSFIVSYIPLQFIQFWKSCCIIFHYVTWYYIILHCITLYCVIPHYSTVYSIIYIILYSTCNFWHCRNTLLDVKLHCILSQHIILHGMIL
jgi:hypothetical protein